MSVADIAKYRRHPFACAMLGLAFTYLLFASPAFAANEAETFAQQNIDKGYAILNNKNLSDAERRAQFRDFLLRLTDLRRIGIFTLGPYARDASSADIDGFVAAFQEYAVSVYQSRLNKYKSESMRVTGSTERAADDVIVNAQVTSNSDNPTINVAFRIRKNAADQLIVTDMQVEGVWLAISERSEFTAYLQQNGGSIPKLSAHLHELAEKVRTGQASE